MADISAWITLLIIAGMAAWGAIKRIDCLDAFATGAKNGIYTCLHVLPYMAAMFVAVYMLRRSGALSAAVSLLRPLAEWIGLPPASLSVAIVRPFSGSAALAALADIMREYGADSPESIAGCVIMGSSETLFYTAALYFGAAGVRKWRYTVIAGLAPIIVGLIAAAIVMRF